MTAPTNNDSITRAIAINASTHKTWEICRENHKYTHTATAKDSHNLRALVPNLHLAARNLTQIAERWPRYFRPYIPAKFRTPAAFLTFANDLRVSKQPFTSSAIRFRILPLRRAKCCRFHEARALTRRRQRSSHSRRQTPV